MNPQHGNVLHVAASSPGLVPFVPCFRKGFRGRHREETVFGCLETHLHADEIQARTLFKLDRNVRRETKDWDIARRLVAQRDAQKGKKRTESNPVSRDPLGQSEHQNDSQ